jgi:hypothetical protein
MVSRPTEHEQRLAAMRERGLAELETCPTADALETWRTRYHGAGASIGYCMVFVHRDPVVYAPRSHWMLGAARV